MPKRVRFSCIVNAILIPCINDYKLYDLQNHIWWNNTDYINFKRSANHDIFTLMQKHPGYMNYKDAQNILYQPLNHLPKYMSIEL